MGPSVLGARRTWGREAPPDSPTAFAVAATLSEGFVTRTVTVSNIQREQYMQSFRQHGWHSRRTWLPALPPRVLEQRFVSSIPWFCFQMLAVFADFVVTVALRGKRANQYKRPMPMVVGTIYAIDVALR